LRSVDGHIDTVFTENQPMRFEAAGWDVIEVERPKDNENEAYVSRITDALQKARNTKNGRPTLWVDLQIGADHADRVISIIVPSIIGHGLDVQGKADAHATYPVTEETGKKTKENLGVSDRPMFHIPSEVYDHFAHIRVCFA
jgi:transketolase